jgi:hypothetical protein
MTQNSNDPQPQPDLAQAAKILEAVRPLAIEYYLVTGKPLGITSEIAEFEAARILGLELCGPRQAGYDACRTTSSGETRIQIKGRRLMDAKSGRVGTIRLTHEWDSVILVLLDVEFYAKEI